MSHSTSSAVASPATISGGGTSLAEYRALLQVLVYASQKQHEASDVVYDAHTGGVVTSFCDEAQRCGNSVILPSSKTVGTVAPLITEGLFSPSLSYTLDNTFGTPFQPLSETLGRDAFTLVILLFPDCFVSGPPLVGGGGGGEVTNARSASSSLARTPEVEVHGRSSPAVATPHRHSRDVSLNSTMVSHAQSVSLSGTAYLVNALSSAPTPANIFQLHAQRLRIACLYLSIVNDTMNDVQVRLLLKHRAAAKTKDDPKSTALSDTSAEICNIKHVKRLTERLKMMLLCCICSAHIAYQACAKTAAGDSISSRDSIQPNLVLEDMVGTAFSEPVEHWDWGHTDEQADKWYDDLLEIVCDSFKKAEGVNLETFLNTMKTNSLREDGRVITHAPEMLLHRATDGHRGVTLELLPHTISRPVLPAMPVSPGELMMLMPTTTAAASTRHHVPYQQDLLFDDMCSPLAAILSRWTARRLTDSQLKDEAAAFFSTPWASLSTGQQRVVADFVVREANLSRTLDKNPTLLARLVLWGYGVYGDGASLLLSSTTEDEDDSSSIFPAIASSDSASVHRNVMSDTILKHVIGLEFTVAVGHFVRELVNHSALTRHAFCVWVRAQRNISASSHKRTFILLVDLVLTQKREWRLPVDVQGIIDEVKQK